MKKKCVRGTAERSVKYRVDGTGRRVGGETWGAKKVGGLETQGFGGRHGVRTMRVDGKKVW